MELPKGLHYNVVLEPKQESNQHTGPFVIGYCYPNGPFGSRRQTYKVALVLESVYHRKVAEAKRTLEPWTFLYESFRPDDAERAVWLHRK